MSNTVKEVAMISALISSRLFKEVDEERHLDKANYLAEIAIEIYNIYKDKPTFWDGPEDYAAWILQQADSIHAKTKQKPDPDLSGTIGSVEFKIEPAYSKFYASNALRTITHLAALFGYNGGYAHETREILREERRKERKLAEDELKFENGKREFEFEKELNELKKEAEDVLAKLEAFQAREKATVHATLQNVTELNKNKELFCFYCKKPFAKLADVIFLGNGHVKHSVCGL